jgi:hypothetical protein
VSQRRPQERQSEPGPNEPVQVVDPQWADNQSFDLVHAECTIKRRGCSGRRRA